MMKFRIKAVDLFLALLLGSVTNLSAQGPYQGMFVQEVPIPQPALGTIQAILPGAKCYHVYVCTNDPFWELQSVYGFNPFILDLTPVGAARFYQSIGFGGPTSLNINPAFFPFFPEIQYDSFVTINYLTNVSNGLSVVSSVNWSDNFEMNGLGLLFNDAIGTSWNVAVNRTPPGPFTVQNIADGDGAIRIYQLVTDGLFTGHANFQFRKLNADYSVYLPVTSAQVYAAAFENTPGVTDIPCPLLILPIGLVSFNAKPTDLHVDLFWVTESEVNNDYFTIERSKDGLSFEEVVRVDGAGNASSSRSYSTIDPLPYEGLSYYRLKQTDFNGQWDYSDMIPVRFSKTNQSLGIYPNPVTDQDVFVSGRTDNLQRYRLFSSDGRLLLEKETRGEPFYGIELKNLNLAAGLYAFEFTLMNGQVLREKLLVR